ncbi:glycosyltransferase [Propioniciclava sp. MC1595]|uniref:glycosyltransferase n=1 Tax=Propioniciclava sp. MC1595 TaxID=2760308 RepID=UPI0016627836|nr:glycosyltransferase [Propioniciclava sp. MC1595]MBB1494622.1 glycosyltransferase [Propioniciclava sp. MC1595]QTE27386.1 glycosyltransferase [Propioniciclava sp. MC1595]
MVDSYDVAVVTYRRQGSLRTVLSSLAGQTIPPSTTVVADNDPDRSAEAVVRDLQGVWPGRLLYSHVGANLGPAGGWAHAAHVAAADPAARGTWLLVLDDDDPLQAPTIVESLLEVASRHERLGAVGLRGARLDRRRARLRRVEPPTGESEPVEYLASGGAPLYRWRALDEVGFFDDRLFFGFEDLDLGLRLARAGWPVRVAPRPDLHVVPNSAATRSPWREYYKTRALVWILKERVGHGPALVAAGRSLAGGVAHSVRHRAPSVLLGRLRAVNDGWRARLGVRPEYQPGANPPKAVPTPESLSIAFVSGVDVGGAPRSTLELARCLAERGHRVTALLGRRAQLAGPFGRAVNAVIKVRRRLPFLDLRPLLRPVGRTLRPVPEDSGVRVWSVDHPENAVGGLLRDGRVDVLVANSFSREQMRWIAADAARAGVPWVLYMREDHSATHFTVSGLTPDAILANSRALAAEVPPSAGEVVVAPSIIHPPVVESLRTAVVLVNPVAENRPEIVRALAARRPDIPCVLQVSWPLPDDHVATLSDWARDLSNLEVRDRTPAPAEVYADARLLVATYPAGRPRVVHEAQANGIPVVALDQPALAEAVGPGGVFVAASATTDTWVDAILAVWDDATYYERLSDAARAHAARDEMDPEGIVDRVEVVLKGVLA